MIGIGGKVAVGWLKSWVGMRTTVAVGVLVLVEVGVEVIVGLNVRVGVGSGVGVIDGGNNSPTKGMLLQD